MNVRELKAVLAELPGDMEVILSKDGEGNEFRRLSETVTREVFFVPEIEMTSDDDGADDDGVTALVLWPGH